MYNERLYSREGAAELLGISVSTLADYELGNTKVVPVDKVVLMADLYNAPELKTGYCKYECPICSYLPVATEAKGLEGIALRLMKRLDCDELNRIKKELVDIVSNAEMKVRYRNSTYTIYTGENIMYDIVLYKGANDLYFQGTGKVTLIHRGGML